jgi:hypothetical protein
LGDYINLFSKNLNLHKKITKKPKIRAKKAWWSEKELLEFGRESDMVRSEREHLGEIQKL